MLASPTIHTIVGIANKRVASQLVDSHWAPARLRSMPSWLINQTSARAHRLVGEKLRTVDAHRYHYSVLAALDELGATSQAELGRRCGLDRSDVAAVVTELADRGFIRRVTDADDRRRNTVSMTASGRRRLRSLDSMLRDTQKELLAPLSAAERDHLVRLLLRVVEGDAGDRRP
jgi:MarR family transcriptional regulator, lower aerobic nicotinate degradation pathway regulator